MTSAGGAAGGAAGDDVTIVVYAGDLDTATNAGLEASVASAGGSGPVVFDLHEVGFMDSAGLGALVAAIRRLRDTGRAAALAAPRPNVMKLLRVTGCDQLVPVAPTVAAARDTLRCAHATSA